MHCNRLDPEQLKIHSRSSNCFERVRESCFKYICFPSSDKSSYVFENLDFHLNELSVAKALGLDYKLTPIQTAEKLRFKYPLSSFTATKGSNASF